MQNEDFQPVSGMDLPRFAGVPTFMRLPLVTPESEHFSSVDIGLIGAPWDGGTTNRPGPRHAPRQIRDYSTMIRAQNGHTKIRPFEMANCADLGDVAPNPASVDDTLARMEAYFSKVKAASIMPMTVGGDHLCALPVLRALARDGDEKTPLGMIHFDSHTDLFHSYFGGFKYTHGTPFRRAVEEGLLDPKRVCMIGIRGTAYDSEDRDFADSVGIRVIAIEEFFERGVESVMEEAREIAGESKTYVSYDIDFIDPTFAPGTGTPEIGGPNSFQAIEVIRRLDGLNFAGADLVEVSPPFDQSGNTAYLAASLIFEMLCVMAPGVK